MKNAVACADRQRRTCIVVERSKSEVNVIRLNVEDGFSIETLKPTEFDRDYKPMVDYPAERAARLYAGYSRTLGATKEAMQALGLLTEVTNEDIKMATAKKTAKAASGVVKAKAKGKSTSRANEEQTLNASIKTGTSKADLPNAKKTAAKKAAAKKPAAKTAPKAKKEAGDKKPRESAAGLFCDLIRAGKLSDDQIFAKVQEKFGLDDKKRSYVSWYRNYLRKNGETVPDAK